MSTFIPVGDDELIRLIQLARRRIVFVAPGIAEPVVQAIGKRASGQSPPDITVVVDPDEEVCRIGYGDDTGKGLRALQALVGRTGLSFRAQPGLRVGVLLADDDLVVWAPTPRSVEAPPETSSAPNGLRLGTDPGAQLVRAIAADEHGDLSKADIGREEVNSAQVDQTLEALKANPPIPVDLARVTRVFNTKLQFVELEIKHARRSKTKLTVESRLLNADARDDLKDLIDSKLRAFADLRDEEVSVPDFTDGEPTFDADGKPRRCLMSEAALERRRHEIERRYVYDIKSFGRLIEKARKQAFQKEVLALEVQLKAHFEGLAERIEEQMARILDDAVDLVVLRLLRARPNDRLDPDQIRTKLADGLSRGSQQPPSVSFVFKDVTYEQTRDPHFRALIKEALPAAVQKRLGPWDSHFEAARAAGKEEA